MSLPANIFFFILLLLTMNKTLFKTEISQHFYKVFVSKINHIRWPKHGRFGKYASKRLGELARTLSVVERGVQTHKSKWQPCQYKPNFSKWINFNFNHKKSVQESELFTN
jgi:hypothetical protein